MSKLIRGVKDIELRIIVGPISQFKAKCTPEPVAGGTTHLLYGWMEAELARDRGSNLSSRAALSFHSRSTVDVQRSVGTRHEVSESYLDIQHVPCLVKGM